jgi:Ca2+-binding EF-hand superfamily protein
MSIINELLANEEKLEKLAKIMFDAIDNDESGKIKKDELADFLSGKEKEDKNSYKGITKKESLKEEEKEESKDKPLSIELLEQAWNIINSDGSDDIDLGEFKEFLRQLLESLIN